ncbi:MAG: hypothetical protein WAU88_03270 [Candidatus Zixiibacteriota bacterium]
MCTSERQIQANQENAQLSTGPKTEEGKAASSRNATKHGLYSKHIILNSPHHTENPEEFEQLLDSLIEELQPETIFQHHLVRKIAFCIWRSRRAVLAETAQINHQLSFVDLDVERDAETRKLLSQLGHYEIDDPTEDDVAQSISHNVGTNLVPGREFAHNILWYEMRLDRQITRAYQLLMYLKKHPVETKTPVRPGLEIFEK